MISVCHDNNCRRHGDSCRSHGYRYKSYNDSCRSHDDSYISQGVSMSRPYFILNIFYMYIV